MYIWVIRCRYIVDVKILIIFFPESVVNINIYNKDEAISQIEECLNSPDKFYNSAVFDAEKKSIIRI